MMCYYIITSNPQCVSKNVAFRIDFSLIQKQFKLVSVYVSVWSQCALAFDNNAPSCGVRNPVWCRINRLCAVKNPVWCRMNRLVR